MFFGLDGGFCAEPEAWASDRICGGSDVAGLAWFCCISGRVGVDVLKFEGPARGGTTLPFEEEDVEAFIDVEEEIFGLTSSNSGLREARPC